MPHHILQVYWYWDEATGEFDHRIRRPSNALSREADFQVSNIHLYHPLFPELALQADLVVLHMIHQPEIYPVITLRQEQNKPTVFEIADDFLDRCHPMFFKSPDLRQNLLFHASLCDLVQFTTYPIRDLYHFLERPSAVFPNQIHAPPELPEKPEAFVVGWGGSLGHMADLAEIKPVIANFLERHPDAVFHLMGARNFRDEIFNDLPESSFRFTSPGKVELYNQFLSGLHVGLAPLRDTPFNRSRSDSKFLEYAAFGVCPVLADIQPYREHGRAGNALLFNSPQALEQHLERLYKNREELDRFARCAHRHVREERNPERCRFARVAAYRRLLTKPPNEKLRLSTIPAAPASILGLTAAHEAISAKRYKDGLVILRDILDRNSDYHAAHLLLVSLLKAMKLHDDLFALYSEYKPPAIFADLFYESMAMTFAKSHPGLAKQWCQKIHCPLRRHFSIPVASRSLEEEYRLILQHRPFDYRALKGLARILGRRPGHQDEAKRLWQRVRRIDGILIDESESQPS